MALRRRRRPPRDPRVEDARRAFEGTVEAVERGKAALVAAVPSARAPGREVAGAVREFEEALAEALARMGEWRVAGLEDVWPACHEALNEATARAEALRLSAPPLDFESLVTVLGDLMDPLDAFEDAERAFGQLR